MVNKMFAQNFIELFGNLPKIISKTKVPMNTDLLILVDKEILKV